MEGYENPSTSSTVPIDNLTSFSIPNTRNIQNMWGFLMFNEELKMNGLLLSNDQYNVQRLADIKEDEEVDLNVSYNFSVYSAAVPNFTGKIPYLKNNGPQELKIGDLTLSVNDSVPINHGDKIFLSKENFFICEYSEPNVNYKIRFPKDVTNIYQVYDKILFHNSRNKVMKCVEKNDCKVLVIKIIKLQEDFDSLKEVNILKKLENPLIISLIDSIVGDTYLYMMFECIKDTLYSMFINQEDITEEDKLFFFFQISKGVEYLHKQKVIHRDIKPLNILMKNMLAGYLIKIIDFGASTMDVDYCNTFIGTEGFMAPEILENNYNNSVDIYSLGSTLYWMYEKKIAIDASQFRNPKYEVQYAQTTPDKIRKLIGLMMGVSPESRPSIGDVLNVTFISCYQKRFNDLLQSFTGNKTNNIARLQSHPPTNYNKMQKVSSAFF